MQITHCEFSVLGIGHLAAAVRLRLLSEWAAPEGDFEPAPAAHTVFIACSDHDCALSFAAVTRLASNARSSVLFAWISEGLIKIGPLEGAAGTSCSDSRPSQRCDFSLSDAASNVVAMCSHVMRNPDMRLKSLARFGATLVVRELAGLQFGPGGRLVGRVAKFGAPPMRLPGLAGPSGGSVSGWRYGVVP